MTLRHELLDIIDKVQGWAGGAGKLDWWRGELDKTVVGLASHPLTVLIQPLSAERSTSWSGNCAGCGGWRGDVAARRSAGQVNPHSSSFRLSGWGTLGPCFASAAGN